MVRRYAGFILGLALALTSEGVARGDDIEEFYHNHNVSVVIGHEAGSGFDVYGRALARFMGRHMPGNPSFVAQNMVGAVGLNAANWIYNIAPKDGAAIAIFAHTAILEPLLGSGAGKFDALKFTWIGNMDQVVGICGVSEATNVKTFEDLQRTETLFGSAGVGSAGPLSQYPLALKNLVGAKIKMIQGYKGSAEIKLAMGRGEVQGICGLPISTLKTEWRDELSSGRFRMLLQMGLEKHPDIPDTPHVYDYARSDEDKRVFDLIFGIQAIGRIFAAPPGIPPARAAALRKAFDDTMNDPEFLEEAKRIDLDIHPLHADAVRSLIDRFYSSPPAAIERAKQVIKPN